MGVDLTLQQAENAYIDPRKLRDYALNPEHPKGKHKARVFQSALGIGQDDWEYLRDQILEGIIGRQVNNIRVDNPYGIEYELRLPIDGLNGETHVVVTAWMLDAAGNPRLTTLYPESS